MNQKIKILCLSLWYPLSMSRYFEEAMRFRDDIDIKTCGIYTANWIPWKSGVSVPMKYAKPPDIPLPFQPNVGRVSYDLVKAQLPKEWIPDIVICVDAGICWTYKPSDGIVVHIATDPHVLDYSYPRTISDKFFNMQLCYSQGNDIYLPYAYSPRIHYPDPNIVKDTDAVLIGLAYEHRVRWVDELRKRGVSVIFENGPVFDEYREQNNRARIGLNWSSLNDLNARFFELCAMKLAPVMNSVPDANRFLNGGIDYCRFSDLRDAIEQVIYLRWHDDKRIKMSENAYNAIQGQTYDSRVTQILQECGF